MNRIANISFTAATLTLVLGGLASVQASPSASAKEPSRSTPISVDASVGIDNNALELEGPVSDFDVKLPDVIADPELDASVTEEGTSAEFTTTFANPDEAVFETGTDDDVDIEVVKNDEGEQSVVLTNSKGDLVGGIAIEEAHTADGNQVSPELSIEGSRVIQTFKDKQNNVDEPITVKAYASTVWYKRGWVTKKSGKKYIVNVDPTKLGRKQIAWNTHKTHVKHAKKVLGAANTKKYWNYNIEQQFVCHVVGAWFPSGVYNMESWQPSLAWGKIANPVDRCNRSKK
ncbi:hypothetical protein [Brevibacterium aurantiacum]|uniref:hypothetical protein n=1 Tax=Brevibacterium aurantiacum TaxID=273384 RepID=UPI000FC9BD49|nr:hypothetical protein [Brevibacterium aurantiacum]